MKNILEQVARGEISVEDAEKRIRELLKGEVSGRAVLDLLREERVGVPEVVLGEGKSAEDLIEITERFVGGVGEVAVTRVDQETAETVVSAVEGRFDKFSEKYETRYWEKGRVLTIKERGRAREQLGGVLLVTAGTSDIPVAEEAKALLLFYGAEVKTFYDVGVAGIHRLFPVVEVVEGGKHDVCIVFAGREGALPTLLASLIPIPVIGVPVSTGYGYGGGGEAALKAMLQSCAPLTVVNVDSGFTAAMVALKILKRINRVREKLKEITG